jgi:di/tricarboxylate transporter
VTWEAWVTLFTIALILFALARNMAGSDVVLMGALTMLMTLSAFSDRFPSPRQLAGAFGNEGLLTVAVLFVVAAGLTETGGIGLAIDRLLGRPRSVRDAQARMMLPVAGVSAVLNTTPVVAMFIPVVSDWSRKSGISPSKLMIPLSYAAVLGGTCTLIGTSTNLVVHGLMLQAQKTDPSMPVMQMLTITPVGVPATIAGIGFILLVGNRLLPDRKSARTKFADPRQYTVEMLVDPGSAIHGASIEQAGLRRLPGMYLAAIERGGESRVAVGPEEVLRGGDRLVFVGVVESVVDLRKIRGLTPATDQIFKLNDPRENRCMVEAVVSNTCPIVGKSIRAGEFRSRYDAVVIAVHRNGEHVDQKIGDIVLRPGDTLLLETHRRFLRNQRNRRDFFLVSHVPDSAPLRHDRAYTALAIVVAMVLAMSLESYTGLGVLNIALVAAALMGITRCVSAEQARRRVEWPTLVTIGAALGLGLVTESTGLADNVAQRMIGLLHGFGPVGVLAGVYFITLVFTEVVTNNAAAALAFPIAHAAATGLGVNFMPFAIAITMAASAGFATPLGYQTHLMVYGAGGYRFSDYIKIGIPLDFLILLITLILIPMIFPFR